MTAGRVGIDVGGTKCLAVVLDDAGTVVGELRRPTPRGPDAIIDTLAEMAGEIGPYDSLGVGVPGLVARDGTLVAAPNLVDIAHFEVGRLLAERLGHAVHIDNDATCAAAAEWRLGAGRGTDDVVLVTLGTGIGGGIIADGRVRRGANGFAGEFGHMVVDPDGPACPCGRRGCWERYASGSGLAMLGRQAAIDGRLAGLVERVGGVEQIRGEQVRAAASEGDADALAVVDEFGRWVALGLVNLTNAFDPAMILLGGGLASSAELFLGPIRHWFDELLYSADLRPHPVLRFTELGERSGAVGAAILVDVH